MNVNLSNCDQEPIRTPGGIQPHGFLFVLSQENLNIVKISQNVLTLLEKTATEIIETCFLDLVASSSDENLKNILIEDDFKLLNPLRLKIKTKYEIKDFDAIAHSHAGNLILELEPILLDEKETFHSTKAMKSAFASLKDAASLQDLCSRVVSEVRRLTGFDRVVLYRFDEHWNGEVVAENKSESVSSFFGLHFPASDIPKQARELYRLNWIRLIPTIHYKMSPIIDENENIDTKIDLSFSVLRSVSPIHLEYLQNMKVKASMSISIIKDGNLWGLISCTHERGEKYLPYELRSTCEFLGEITASLIAAKQGLEDSDYRIQLSSSQATLLHFMSHEKSFVRGLFDFEPNLMDVAGADGAAIFVNGKYTAIGKAPTEDEIQDLIRWLSKQPYEEIMATDSLPEIYFPAEKFKDRACGMLAAPISKGRGNYIFWFRPEVIQTINWSGNPNKTVVEEDGKMRIHPRRSFELWKETVRGKSLPWKEVEKESASVLRKSMIDLILEKTEELSKLNLELERSNVELDSFAYAASHDLKEPLRGIHNYTNLAIEELGESRLIGRSGDRLQTVLKLTQRMEDLINSLLHYSQVGRMDLSRKEVNLNQVVSDVLEMLKPTIEQTKTEVQVHGPLPILNCDEVQIGEVFSNLISNALKYNDKPNRKIDVGVEWGRETAPVIFVRDNGIGIREKNLDAVFRIFKRLHKREQFGGGSGTGLTITKKIVERHGGRVWIESRPLEGSTFFFTLTEGPTGHA